MLPVDIHDAGVLEIDELEDPVGIRERDSRFVLRRRHGMR